ncbi:hypothetical protein CYY_000657 [Polysphondylium violaceum]|uniref:Uncharacterized protein n=1 Tax=Polysphondylium violaceum TaxID=133409 RepID=A0A8J4Q373_9MYCE|nr:hypothetical protein CYY_000657 [Polysphondylium violaceum]
MPLPLVARKSLRDNQEHLDAAVEKIKAALGVEWTFEIDFETIMAKVTDSDYVKNSPGECFYKEVAGYVAECIDRAAKNEMVKEALIEANTNSKIIVALNEDKKNSSYWTYKFNNGTLELLFKSICNTSDICYFKLENIIPTPGVYSLPARMNLKAAEEKFNEAFEKIKVATGADWSLDEASLEALYPSIDKSYQESIGDIFSEIVEYAAQNITKRLGDEMVKEAFLELTPNSKLVFKCNPKLGSYWEYAFQDGNLVISFRSICNTSDVAYYDFEKLL